MNTKLITLGLALFLGFSLNAQKKEIKNAEKAISDNNFPEALKELEDAKSLGILNEGDKWVIRYHTTKGNAYLGENSGLNQNLENLKKSGKAFNEALSIDESDTDAQDGLKKVRASLINIAIESQNNNDFSNSKDFLYASYELSKKDTINLYYAAGSAVSAGELEDAVTYFKELLALGYDGASTQYYAYTKDTNVKENFGTDKSYRDLMVRSNEYVNPEDVKSPSVKAEIAKNISTIYIQLKESEKAIEAIKIAREMNPDDITLIQAEADLYYQLDDLKKYQELMNIIKEKAPNDPVVYFNLGVSAEQLEDTEAAKEFYKTSIKLDPEYINSYLNLSALILSAEKPLVDEMNGLGMSKADNKRYEQLQALKTELYQEALPYLQKAYNAKPDNIGVLQTLMNIHYQLGNNEDAKLMKAKLDEIKE